MGRAGSTSAESQRSDFSAALEGIRVQIARARDNAVRAEHLIDNVVGPVPSEVNNATDEPEPHAYADKIRVATDQLSRINSHIETQLDRLAQF